MVEPIKQKSRMRSFDRIRQMNREELEDFVSSSADSMIEEEALAVLDNHFCTNTIIARLAQSPRLTGRYSVKRALVAHRLTPQGHAMKFVHHLQWRDLLRLSTDVRVPPAIRRSIEESMKLKLPKLTLGEKIASAKFCSRAIMNVLMSEKDTKIFASLLLNSRLTEEQLLQHVDSETVPADHLRMVADHPKWSLRYPLVRALVRNPETPRAVAASLLTRLRKDDLEEVSRSHRTSRYLRACIERLGLLHGNSPAV